MGPIYSGEPGGCRHGPVLRGQGLPLGGGVLAFLHQRWVELCTWCSGSRSCSEGGQDKTVGCILPCIVIPARPMCTPPVTMADMEQVRLWAYRVCPG